MHGVVRIIAVAAMLAGAASLAGAAGKAAVDLSGEWTAELTQKGLPNQDKVYQRVTIQQNGALLTGNARAGALSGSVQGNTVRTWTVDAGGAAGSGVRLSAGGNPETGPFFIEGALPGDTLAVTLVRVSLNRDTAMRYDIAEVVDPYYHVVARLPKETLARIAR